MFLLPFGRVEGFTLIVGQPEQLNLTLWILNMSSGVVSWVLADTTSTLPILLEELMSAQRGEVLVVSLSSRVPETAQERVA